MVTVLSTSPSFVTHTHAHMRAHTHARAQLIALGFEQHDVPQKEEEPTEVVWRGKGQGRGGGGA